MAFLKLESENKNLSWVLEKNPETGIVIKPCKKGFMFGYFPLIETLEEEKVTKSINAQQYCIYFKDASDEISYRKNEHESFEYLSASKYNNARFINDSIEALLKSARENKHDYLKEEKDYDISSNHKMTFNLIETQYKTIDIFERYFTELQIKSEEIAANNFKISFATKDEMTLSNFLNIINLFGIFAVLNSDDYIYIEEEIINKYLRILNKIDVPYFIRYLFKVRLLRYDAIFFKMKPELEKTKKYYELQFTPGSSHDARIAWVKHNLSFSLPIVDIGAGIDYKYLKYYAPKLQGAGLTYYAIEQDQNARERIKAGCRNRHLDNVEIYESFDAFLEVYNNEKINILCTEVLEHNELPEVEKILLQILKTNFSRFLTTVPNADFNKFYGLENAMRHDDHKWELGFEAFKKLMTDFMEKENIELTRHWSEIGDVVNDISVSTGLILSKE